MQPAMSGRTASTPVRSSKARSVASLMNVPPCTITCVPISRGSRSLITLKSAFLITEYESPAAMSPTVAPSFCACFTREFMKTVQRLPRSTGWRAPMASCANSSTPMSMDTAKLSMKEPQPEEHASLSMMCSITPSATRRHFMSWPPMSRMNCTPGRKAFAPRRCATVSISPESALSASMRSASP